MDEQRRRPDPSSRPDPYELAVARAASSEDGEPGPEEDGTPPLPRLQVGPFRVGPTALLLGVVLLVGAGTLVRYGGDRTPELARSCTAHAVALSAERVRPGGLVEYAVVGPADEVVLAVFPAARGAGAAGDAEQVLPPVRLQGCRGSDRFGAQVPPGAYVVGVLVDGAPVATEELTVTEPGDPLVD